MKADPTDLTNLLELQGLDLALEQVKHRASTLPVHQSIAELTQARLQAKDEAVAAQTALSDASAAAERAESDVVPVRERLARNQARVDSGEMTAKALSSALDEIDHLKQRVSDLEDAQLEAMENLELTTSQVGLTAERVETVERELRELIGARDAEVAALAAEAKGLAQSRTDQAALIPADLLGLYEKIRARSGGVGVAKFENGRCSGCGLEATVADCNRYRQAPADDLVRCAECERILVR